jgi:hypothetical protein
VELSSRQSQVWAVVPPGMLLAFGSILAAELGYERRWLEIIGLVGLAVATGAIAVVFVWKGAELLRRRRAA